MIGFGEQKGDLWQIHYFMKTEIDIPDHAKNKFLDEKTRMIGSTFDAPSGLSPSDYESLFLKHFRKSRQEFYEKVDEFSIVKHKYSELFQVGNLECLDELQKIESDSNFHSWENPSMVEYFRKISELYR